jgi:hypothetical protein
VISSRGEPLSGALVTCSASSPEDRECEPAWHEDDWGTLPWESSLTTTNAEGRFAFTELPASTDGYVLWASAEGALAGCLLLSLERSQQSVDHLIRLEDAQPFLARVVDSAGNPVPGAAIEQHGLIPAWVPGADATMTPERARRLLRRSYDCDETGQARLHPFPGEQVLVARRQGEFSRPWRGAARQEITLQLAPAFTVGGRVTLPDWSHLDYSGERRIRLAASRGSVTWPLASLRPVEAGPFGPIELPVIEGATYSLSLEGSPIIPLERLFSAPPPGTHLSFDLAAELGHDLWVLAVDESQQTILNSEAEVFWEEDGRTRVLRRRARPDGYINPWSVPAGTVSVRVSAPGYVPTFGATVTLPEREPTYTLVVLQRATRLRGFCLHEGQPVRDFEVLAWQDGQDPGMTSVARCFRDRTDGSFDLEGVPTGTVMVTASSDVCPRSRPLAVRLPRDEPILLELPDALIGTGQIVSISDRAPVTNARVQPFITGFEGPIRPWGAPWTVDGEGRFKIPAFAPGNNYVRVEAPGLATRWFSAVAAEGAELDFGQLLLSTPQTLVVRLEADRPIDFSSFQVQASRWNKLPCRSFDSAGSVRFEGVGAGGYLLEILRPDGPWVNLRVELKPGADWVVRHKVAGSRIVNIEVVPEEDKPLEGYRGLLLSYTTPDGIFTQWGLEFPPDGRRSVEGIYAEHVEVSVLDASVRECASAAASFEGKDELHLRVELGGEPFTVHVLDDEGEPVAGASVFLLDPSSAFYRNGTSDQGGACQLLGVPGRALLASVEHATQGRRYGVPVDGAAGEGRIVLSSRAGLELVFRDGQVPVRNVLARFVDASGAIRFSMVGSSDAEGRLRADALSPGPCRIAADHPDCWPVTFEAEASEDPGPKEVQIRRLGGVLFELRTAQGLPLAHQRLELASVEFQRDVDSWIEQKRVTGPAELQSDLRGEILLERLPRGSYRWSLRSPSGEELTGSLEVPAGQVLAFPIVIPE